MITVKFRERKLSHRIRLEVKGHAQLVEEGYDVCCESASTLTYTIAQLMKVNREKGWLVDEPRRELNKGDAVIECRPEYESYITVLNQFMVILTGFQILQAKYPDLIRLI